jgi:oxygen-dependent protoporphyrinogen oxidase
LAALEREHGSVVKGMSAARKQRRAEAVGRGEGPPGRAKMWSFGEGLAKLIDSLREHLRRQPETGCSINGVVENPSPPRWRVSAADGRSWDADAVALTCPAYVQAELLAEVDAALAAKIREIPYNRIAVVALGFRREDVPSRLDGFGYLAPQTPPRDVLGVQWCSSIFPDRRAPKDAVLLRALCGGWRNPDIVDWDDVRLVAAVRDELTTTMRITSEPLFQRVVRWGRAIPQYHVGHLDRVAGIELAALRHPGLFLGGNAYRGVAINDCVEQANMLAGRIRDWLADAIAST